MEHTKKLVLMEPKLVKPTIRDKTLSKLDEHIESILRSDLPDDLKAKYYASSLRTYKTYDEEKKKPENKIEKLETDVLKSISPNNQYKANRILALLKRDPDVTFSKDGEVVYKRNVIRDSNITDIIVDLLKKTSGASLPGLKEVSSSLKSYDVSKELIPNQSVWKLMHPPLPRTSTKTLRKSQRPKSTVRWEKY